MEAKNWKTTLAGILAAIALLCTQAGTVLDDDPKTNPDVAAIFGAFAVFGIGWSARDAS